jgi:hypothetical protein
MQRRNDHEVDQLDPVAPGMLESSAEYPMALFIDSDWRKQGKNSDLREEKCGSLESFRPLDRLLNMKVGDIGN